MKVKIDGTLTEFKTVTAVIMDVAPKKALQIVASKGTTEGLSIMLNDYTGQKTYDLSGNKSIVIFTLDALRPLETTFLAEEGKVVITSATAESISGTFEFKAKNMSDDSEKIFKEGSFTVSLVIPKGPNPTPTPTTYYLSLKVDNKAVNLDFQTALRGQVNGNNTLSIQASAKDNKNPKLSFYYPGSFIGIVKGLNIVGFGKDSDSELKYTNESGKEYSTKLDEDGGYFTILDVKYENGGYVVGKFSGSLTSSDKSKITITEGLFKVQFSN
ncbi:DUF6252 family protein [Pedobacter sp. ASV28]|uniref:DUF6252 family protein n=1 Tax=Pedobacter sp. ASV28 TaxID=2795123 RepID=UPI0018ECCB2C|nr:DUF6252 family protein [Pedobacter sp. ASV28]